ncbi:MAG: hypothetical protein L3J67_09620 [Hyphomicrobiaceae bacterium]|nr:hypothetical protein [Hyphomicrobiaceae bacterium]
MKKLLIASVLILGTFSAISGASAYEDKTLGSYSGWAFDALSGGDR